MPTFSRLFYLEYVDGLFKQNSDTIEGSVRHGRVDHKVDELPPATEAPETLHARSVTLSSEQYGVVAKLDLIEAEGDMATPVDYKRGSPKKMEDGSLGAWDPERVQICLQALVLREHGYSCTEGILFFWETRQRVRIAIDEQLIRQTLDVIQAARQTMEMGAMPPPLVNSPKCPRCSLVSICLPDETTRCAQVDAQAVSGSQRFLFDIGPRFGVANNTTTSADTTVRQLVTARDEKRPLYLNTQGCYVGISAQVLRITEKEKLIQEIRLKEVNQVNLFGSVQISTQAVQALLDADIPLVYFSFGGWFKGMTQPAGLKNILWRREQFRMADRTDFCLALAKQLVSGKIRNQRTLLMRNHVEPPNSALRYMKSIDSDVFAAESISSLLGIEGLAARVYFEHFSGMIKSVDDATETARNEPAKSSGLMTFDFERRNRRPPRDPVNALLSLGYSLLTKDLMIAITATGLDPISWILSSASAWSTGIGVGFDGALSSADS